MAFKKTSHDISIPASPEELFLELSGRKYPNVFLHQGEMLRAYTEEGIGEADVSLELPTGSGKTLVGLLIAEWRRRKFKDKVVYLCPTIQLVNQVVEEAKKNYGLNVIGYTGSARKYTAEQKANYGFNNAVCVTTYSSLFNSNPFFKNADLLILDDAHACENYLGKYWSLSVKRLNEEHQELHKQIASLISPYLRPADKDRVIGRFPKPADISWVEKLPTRHFNEIRDSLYTLLEYQTAGNDLGYAWRTLRDNFHSCHLFISSTEILIRPALFPTWELAAFSSPQQRLFMSATLSKGGDLERITGRKKIHKIQAPESFKLHGIGRRFFMFPDITLDKDDCAGLAQELIKMSGRALYLVPSSKHREQVIAEIKLIPDVKIFDAKSIEKSKEAFIAEDLSVAVLANRYDGIDFRGDACRLLFVEGLPRAMNLNERFLMDKMAASIIFNERIQTRVVQAVGRCTRSMEDYSAVVILGNDIPDYLINDNNTKHLHPNLQAELKFGKEQSNGATKNDFVENMETFLVQGEDWIEVNNEIINTRNKSELIEFPNIKNLQNSVSDEIDYQRHVWNGDFEKAIEAAEKVLGHLNGPKNLRGYRAWWHYLAGSASELASAENSAYTSKAEGHYVNAREAAPTLQWLIPLCNTKVTAPVVGSAAPCDLIQINKIEEMLSHIGSRNHKKFDAQVQLIRDHIFSNEFKFFEKGLKDLGSLLGFESYNDESDGAPDGWWVSGDQCIVFEAHSNAKAGSVIGSKKARQVESHPKWLISNGKVISGCSITSALITPCITIKKEAHGLLGDTCYLNLEKFRSWVSGVIIVIGKIRKDFNQPGDLVWQTEALITLSKHNYLCSEIITSLSF